MKIAAIAAWGIAFGLAVVGIGLDAGWTAHDFSGLGLALFVIGIPTVGLLIGMGHDDIEDAFTSKPGTDNE